jgi:hypothetical protein
VNATDQLAAPAVPTSGPVPTVRLRCAMIRCLSHDTPPASYTFTQCRRLGTGIGGHGTPMGTPDRVDLPAHISLTPSLGGNGPFPQPHNLASHPSILQQIGPFLSHHIVGCVSSARTTCALPTRLLYLHVVLTCPPITSPHCFLQQSLPF